MKIFGFDIKKGNTPPLQQEEGGQFMGKYPVEQKEYDGEKTDGDLGAPYEYYLDYEAMASRAWQHFIDTDFVSIVLERFLEWIIGTGLRLEAKPDLEVIKSEGFNISEDQLNEFTTKAENRFRLLAGSKLSDYRQISDLHSLSIEIIKNAFLSGDCLVIYRIDDQGLINVDYVNGQDVKTPMGVDTQNRVIQGVELDKKGRHLAYYVQKGLEYEKVDARDKFGRVRAELVTWKKGKRSDVRGLSGLHMVFQKMKNMDRYSEASVQGAVTRANLAYFLETEKDASPASTFLTRANTAKVTSESDTNFTPDTKRKVYADTSKSIFELNPGQKVTMPESKSEINVGDFVTTYFNQFCAAIGIPPEVALQLYTNSFSASRMATKSWEHTLRVKRQHTTIYKSVYRLFIDVQISAGKMDLPQLKSAIMQKNEFLIQAFTKAEMIGVNVPHADPVREAKAHRELLGDSDIPLETAGKATETLGTGDYDEIVRTRRREMQQEEDFKDNNNEQTTSV